MKVSIRRVIFRTETASILLNTLIENGINVSEIGEKIGFTAARDLIKKTIEEKELIPENSETLIKLHLDSVKDFELLISISTEKLKSKCLVFN